MLFCSSYKFSSITWRFFLRRTCFNPYLLIFSVLKLKRAWQNIRKAYRFNNVEHNGHPNYERTHDLQFLDRTFTLQLHLGRNNQRAQIALDDAIGAFGPLENDIDPEIPELNLENQNAMDNIIADLNLVPDDHQ